MIQQQKSQTKMPSQKIRSCCTSNSCGKIPGWTNTKRESDNSPSQVLSLWNELHKITQHVSGGSLPNENNNYQNNDFCRKFTLLPSANDENNHNKNIDDWDEKTDSSSSSSTTSTSSLIFNRHHLCVGQGAWSKVYAGFCNKSFQSVAFKVIPKSKIDNEAICQDVIREIRILRRLRKIAKSIYGFNLDVNEEEEEEGNDGDENYSKLRNRNKLPFLHNNNSSINKMLLPFPLLLGSFHTETEVILVMSRAPGKTLFEFLTERESSFKNNNNNISNHQDEENETTKRVVRSLLQAVHTLHRGCRTGHRDVKLENILIATPEDVRQLVAQEKEFQQLYFSSLSQEHDQHHGQRRQRQREQSEAVEAKKSSSPSSGSDSDHGKDDDEKCSESASKRNENKKKLASSHKENQIIVIANENDDDDVEKKRNLDDLDSDSDDDDDDAEKSNLGVPKFFGSIFDKESMSLKSVSFVRELNSSQNKTQNDNNMVEAKQFSTSPPSHHISMRKINSNNIHVTLVDFGFAHSLPLPIFSSASPLSPSELTTSPTHATTGTSNNAKKNAPRVQTTQKQFALTSHLSCASLDSADMSCCGENNSISSSSSSSSVSSSPRSVSSPATPISESKSEKPNNNNNNNNNNKKNNSSPTTSDTKGGPKFPSACENNIVTTTTSSAPQSCRKRKSEKNEKQRQGREERHSTPTLRKPSTSSSIPQNQARQQSLYFSLRFAPLEILLQLLPNNNNNTMMKSENDDFKSMKQDIFGVGVCAYLLLTGKWPYSGKTAAQLSFQMKSGATSLKFTNLFSATTTTTSSQPETNINNHQNSSEKNKCGGNRSDSAAIAASTSDNSNNNSGNNLLSAARKCVVNLLHSDASKRWRTDEALECEWIC